MDDYHPCVPTWYEARRWPSVLFRPGPWQVFLAALDDGHHSTPIRFDRGQVFLHGLRTPDGRERLVAVDVWAENPPAMVSR